MKKINQHAVGFIFVILIITVSFSVFVFSNPGRFNLWILVMLFPACIGMVINGIRFRSIRKVLAPITGRINLKSMGFAVVFPLVFIGVLALAVYRTGLATYSGAKISTVNLPDSGVVQILTGVVIGSLLMFGEEYGWRGFLLKELSLTNGKLFSAAVVGLVWALYHAPVVYGLSVHHHVDRPLLFVAVQMTAVFILSFPFAHAYFLTGNIIPPMLLHLIWNIVNPAVLGNIYSNQPGLLEGNPIIINGEGLGGIYLGMIFLCWYILSQRKAGTRHEI